jgi:hypothetical protein
VQIARANWRQKVTGDGHPCVSAPLNDRLSYFSKEGAALFFRATDLSYREKGFYPLQPKGRGTRWCSWLRHCVTSRKVAGLIPDCVFGIFH